MKKLLLVIALMTVRQTYGMEGAEPSTPPSYSMVEDLTGEKYTKIIHSEWPDAHSYTGLLSDGSQVVARRNEKDNTYTAFQRGPATMSADEVVKPGPVIKQLEGQVTYEELQGLYVRAFRKRLEQAEPIRRGPIVSEEPIVKRPGLTRPPPLSP